MSVSGAQQVDGSSLCLRSFKTGQTGPVIAQRSGFFVPYKELCGGHVLRWRRASGCICVYPAMTSAHAEQSEGASEPRANARHSRSESFRETSSEMKSEEKIACAAFSVDVALCRVGGGENKIIKHRESGELTVLRSVFRSCR